MPDFLPDDEIDPNLALGEIQGNILAGFNKDHEALIFVHLGAAKPAKTWVGSLAQRVATSKEVIAFNRLFKAVNDRRQDPDDTDTVQATWINLAVTATGIAKLGGDTTGMDASFITGMAQQAERLGDGKRAPAKWVVGRRSGEVHAVLIIASDRRDDLHRAIAHELKHLAAHGVSVIFVQEGHTRSDEPGHEHFGYKDGVSQPGLLGLHRPNTTPGHENQGDLGSDLLEIGEFVLGYKTQKGAPVTPPTTDIYHPSTPQFPGGGPSESGRPWTKNGSYYVFRRLRQDVPAFQAGIDAAAAEIDVTADAMGAIVIGRYKSGAPLEVTGRKPADPGLDDLSLVGDKINDFEYQDNDPDGNVVPRASHVRKTYPRDSETDGGGEDDTQRHRLLRRGIPYGQSYHHGAPPSGPNGRDAAFPLDRGLLFQCYGRSITDQFELVSETWVANKDFTKEDDGVDGVLSEGPMKVPPDHAVTLQRFVTATGGEYFFSPSVTALHDLGAT